MYGYEMTKAVKVVSKGKMQLSEAALSPTLYKLEEEKMIETETKIVNGRARKYYQLNKKGNEESIIQLGILKEAITLLQNIPKYKLGQG